MTDNEELYINECGEAVFRETNSALITDNNPFMELSDDLIENWSPSIIENAAKTWKSALSRSSSSTQLTSTSLSNSTSTIDPKQKEDLFLQDFLNSILPPIPTKIKEKEDIVYSLVSTKQLKRSQLNEISDNFNELIKQRRARKVGLDNIRYKLSFQLFDEIIREIAIDCKERGLLLLRIRDEAKVTLQSYSILKQVASTFSANEGEKSNKGFDELIQTKHDLLEKKKKLQNELLKLKNEMRDKQKEVKVLANVQSQQLEQHKMAMENEANHLKLLIDSKRRRGSGRNRRKSLKDAARKSTRRGSTKDGSLAFSFNSPTMSPTNNPTNK